MTASLLRRSLTLGWLAGAALLVSACQFDISNRAEARDQWTRQYTLAPGGTLEINNTNGLIQIEPSAGNTVQVVAERIVQAQDDAAAKSALSTFAIQETATPDRILLDATNRGANGVTLPSFGVSRRVEFRIKAPEWANVTLDTTNGNITIGPKLTGTFKAQATNGQIEARGLENSVQIGTTNGAVTIEMARLGGDGVRAETTNGSITLTLPTGANARLSARVTNGAIGVEGLNLAIAEQSRRRLDGTLGSGGPMIQLETTNGAIEIKGK